MGERRRHTGTFEVERTTGSHEVLDRLFVYGTLRNGQTARSLIANQITSAERATTTGRMFAFPMGYPGYIEEGSGIVHGEVLWLTELAATFGLTLVHDLIAGIVAGCVIAAVLAWMRRGVSEEGA